MSILSGVGNGKMQISKNYHRVHLRAAVFFLLLTVSLVRFPSSAYACACLEPNSPSEELQRAHAVFIGRALSWEDDRGEVLFEVSSAFKGVSGSQIKVGTGSQAGGDCPVQFVVGETYLVYARYLSIGLYTDQCDRTALLTEANEDLATLAKAESETFDPIIVFAGLFAIVCVALIFLRVRIDRVWNTWKKM